MLGTPDTTRDDTHTHTHNQKDENDKNRNYEMYIPKLLQNTTKTAPKNIRKPTQIDQKSIKNESQSSLGDPSGQRPVFETFFDVFWTKMVSKMEPETIQKVCFFCLFFDVVLLRFLSEK